jgi:hypothetical protein
LERRGKCRVLAGKPKGKRPLGRPWRRWEDVIRMDLRETAWGGAEWIQLNSDKYGDETAVSGATDLVSSFVSELLLICIVCTYFHI